MTKEERNKSILNEKKIDKLVNNTLNIKEVSKDIVSELIYDIQIDKENQIYVNYRYDILNMEA